MTGRRTRASAGLRGAVAWRGAAPCQHARMRPGGLVVREATVADAPALADLRFTWRVEERDEQGLDRVEFEAALTTWMTARTSSHLPFLALRGEVPIGMTWLAIVERIPGPGRFVRRSAYVQSTYVVARERSTGVGTALVTRLLDVATALGLDYVAVHPSERAFSLYRRLGFTESGLVLERR